MVGPNNSGKSTVISSLRILEVGLRRGRSKKAEYVPYLEGQFRYGHSLPIDQITVPMENVKNNYNDDDGYIEFNLTNKNKLVLCFPADGGCYLHWDVQKANPVSPSTFKTAFPLNLQIVPVLGQLEHEEDMVNRETVLKSLNTHRASRHFRNYWNYFPEGWARFSDLVEKTWPGMRLKRPEMQSALERKLTMFVSEDRFDREIFWAGSGFQIWCQLLTHISRVDKESTVIVDEPEVYLHPDVQRQLLQILRDTGATVILATHSVEVMSESDPSEILLINKKKKSATRLKDSDGVQAAIDSLGSTHNVTLAHLARTRKVVFVEGAKDYKIIRMFAKNMGYDVLASVEDMTPIESGGFSSWEKVKSFSWGLKKTMDASIKVSAVYDRDYFCEGYIDDINKELESSLHMIHIHDKKEIENYLLNSHVIQRVVDKSASKKKFGANFDVEKAIWEITEKYKSGVQAQLIAKKQAFRKNGSGKDPSTVALEVIKEFDKECSDLSGRLRVFGGKEILKDLRRRLDTELSISLTDAKIINEFRPGEIPADMVDLIKKLEVYRKS